jgi:drug/metabolite transporter (DMT)-like permease
VGAAGIFARYALTGAGPLAVSAARLCIASAILIGAALLRPERTRSTLDRGPRLTLALAGLALAVHFGTWIASLDLIPVAISTLLVATTPIWTALYDAAVLRRPLSRASALAFAAGAAGLIVAVGFGRTPAPHPGMPLLGDALALLGGAAFAVYLVLVRSVRDRASTRTIVAHTYTWAALALVGAAALAHQPPPPPAATAAWGGILAMALVSQLLGHTAINASLRWFSPSAVAFANLIEPLFAGLLALALFHESLGARSIAGGVVLLAAIAVVLKEDRSGLEIGSVQ